jgi:GAF domain-containing protein/HAMP domain-containing protein
MNESQTTSLEYEPNRGEILTSQIITYNGFLFFALGIYLIIGTSAWQAYVLAGCSVVVSGGALTSTILTRRERINIGRWVLLLTNTIAPALAGLAVTRIGLISAPYIVISSYIITRWVFDGEWRKTIPAIASSTLVAVIIEVINPAWTLDAQIVFLLGPIFITFSLTAGTIMLLLSTFWNTFRISTKLLILVGVILIVAVSTLTWRILINEQEQALSNEEQQLNASIEHYHTHIMALEDKAASLAATFANREEVVELYQMSDRQSLTNLLTPIYTELQNEYNINHMEIVNPDQTVFARIQNPGLFGDDVAYRSTGKTTLMFQEITAGVEIGQDSLGVRGVAPIMVDGKLAGMFEIGITHDNHFLENLKAATNIDYILWVTKDAALGAGLNPPKDALSSPSERIFFYAGTFSNGLEIPEETYIQVLENNRTSGVQLISTENGDIAVLLAPMIGHGEEVIGIIEVIVSRADSLMVIRENTSSIIVTGVIIFLLGLSLLYLALRPIVILPIRQLVRVSQSQLNGDFSIRAPVVSQDEFGQFASTFNALANNVQELIQGLEDRVSERTIQLEEANKLADQHVKQLEAIAQISRSISTIRDIDTLLPRITNMISQEFDFYHVGIFLLDEDSRFAVLRASNSDGGQKMLERGHQLEVGRKGIVGHVASTGEARIAADVGSDSVHFNNPDLPNTRSEMALPLKIGSDIIGVLDVQSTHPGVFSPSDINILSVLSDQVSIAIQNTRLLEETNAALAETEHAYSQLTFQTWKAFKKQAPVLAYSFDGIKSKPIYNDQHRKLNPKESGVFTVPVKLRGVTVGYLRMKSRKENGQWTRDEKIIAQAVAERVALAAENARLFSETTKRAERERLVSEITTKIRSKTDPHQMIQVALSELKDTLGATHVELIPHLAKKTDNSFPDSGTQSDPRENEAKSQNGKAGIT